MLTDWYGYEHYGTHTNNRTITPRDRDLFHVALALADDSWVHYKHGAVIARGRRIISMRVNKLTTHPVLLRYRAHTITLHAEASAIIHARADIAGATLYSARATTQGNPANSKPCIYCMQLLIEAGIANVVFYHNGNLVKCRV